MTAQHHNRMESMDDTLPRGRAMLQRSAIRLPVENRLSGVTGLQYSYNSCIARRLPP